ncbi:unnamed protein product, partial [Timema podura]|nr:unnamed protein product [Timema podura]
VRFIVSDLLARTLNTWSPQQQNIQHIISSLATIGVPPRPQQEDFSVIHGLKAAAEAHCECTDIQHEKRTSLTENASKGEWKTILEKPPPLYPTEIRASISPSSAVQLNTKLVR